MSKVLELCRDLPTKRVMKGESLMTQGGMKWHMAVMKSGKVEVIKDGQSLAVVDEPGAIFGEIAVILRTPHTATVQALEESEFYMIEDPDAFLWERAEFNFELLKILAKRLDSANQSFASLEHQAETEKEAVELIEQIIDQTAHESD